MRVEEHTITLGGAPVFYLSAADEAAPASVPVVYLHGAPTSSDDWTAVLERTGGIAPDLLGFGRSAKGAHLHYTPEALADFVEDLLSALGIEQLKLVTHGWGTSAGVLLAAKRPERVERFVLFNSVPLHQGQSWPWWARVYMMRGVGEVAMGSTTRTLLRRWLRQGSVRTDDLPAVGRRGRRRRRPDASPPDRVARIWQQFDQGTQRAVLRLVRSVDEDRMRTMAASLESLKMPTLVIWGERDPWCGPAVLEAYASRLVGARVKRIPDAGHWPWLDDPSVVELLAGYLQGAPSD